MTPEEMNQEVLECARYGEEDDLRALLNAGANVNFTDAGGSTAMHKAAANGEEACLKVLHSFGATYSKNGTGNTPAHWAAQNAKAGALKFIIENYEVDMLDKNDLGRSVLTEAFQSKCTDCIELCLSHESASEERLINPDGKKSSGTSESAPSAEMTADSNMETEGTENNTSGYDEANAVTHSMQFGADVRIRVRELPITRADNPFGTDTAPEDDTTGLSVWPASIILGQWVAQLARDGALPDMRDKMVLELGAGCGLPAIVAALALRPKVAYVSDIHEPTLLNAAHNVQLNAESVMEVNESSNTYQSSIINFPASETNPASSTSLKVINMSWTDPATYPPEQAALLLGSDLVYDIGILAVLIPAICSSLAPDGSLLYVAPDTGRQGMQELEQALLRVNIGCVEKFSAPDEFYANPLSDGDGDQFVLHFYDLSAKQPHTLYHFKWQQGGLASVAYPETESSAMET